jgi:hypothetical protein
MRVIPTWIHGLLDYPLSILLIALPWLGGFANGGAAQWVPIVAGVAMLGLSAMTAYEAGVVRVVPMPVHLATDAVMGLLLAASPWLFGFADSVWIPFVVLGLGEVGAALTTETRPGHRMSKTAF